MPASWMAWARAHRPAVVVLSLLVLAVAVGVTTAAAGSGGPGEARGVTAVGASAAGTDPPRPAASGAATWLTGPPGKLLDAVTADAGRIAADQRAGSSAAARRDGTRLAGDAAAALRGPMPPVDASLYRFALRDFQQAGVDTASGNRRAASDLLTPASLNVVTITATLNSESHTDSPA
ncbi:MAG TPA: hypothetical protein VHZ03_29505 [Trebonia sp.]|nr:hypothetical protein [Trebonia sp.]